jgi:hypothetical protein
MKDEPDPADSMLSENMVACIEIQELVDPDRQKPKGYNRCCRNCNGSDRLKMEKGAWLRAFIDVVRPGETH